MVLAASAPASLLALLPPRARRSTALSPWAATGPPEPIPPGAHLEESGLPLPLGEGRHVGAEVLEMEVAAHPGRGAESRGESRGQSSQKRWHVPRKKAKGLCRIASYFMSRRS